MRFSGFALAVAATLLFPGSIVALPTSNSNNVAAIDSLPSALEWLEQNSKREIVARQKVPLCKLDNVEVPVGDDTTKLTDAGSLTLKVVALGHGTQNYTCADSTSNTKPVANGAHADLYDASCFASYVPALLKWFPDLFLHNPRAIPQSLLPKIGVHYFHPDASTPVFDINETSETKKKGRFVGKKLEGIPAPVSASAGIAPDAFGAVDWLKLGEKADVKTASGELLSSKGYKVVYRVNTAGGKPPVTCEGRPEHFEVEYATQYWLYN